MLVNNVNSKTHSSSFRKTSKATCNNKQFPRKQVKGRTEEEDPKLIECSENVGIKTTSDSQLESDSEVPTTRALQDRTCVSSDIPHEARQDIQDSSLLSYSDASAAIPKHGCCSNQSMPANTSNVWVPGATSFPQDNACKKPLLTCVLNLNLWDQSCETHYDNSSCIGILSYNHQMGRHEWSLVPQNSPVPLRAVSGKYIRNKISLDSCVVSALPDQSGKFSDGCQLGKESDADVWVETGASEPNDNIEKGEKEDRGELPGQEMADMWQAHDPSGPTSGPTSNQFQFATALSNQNCQDENVSNNDDDIQLGQKAVPGERLKPSGIIYNESYFFEKNDTEDTAPRFLETLISAPTSGEEMSHPYLPHLPEEVHACTVPSAPRLKCPGVKAARRPAWTQSRKTKIQPTAPKTRLHKVNAKSQESLEPFQEKPQSPEHNNSSDVHGHTDRVQEPAIIDEDFAAQTEASTRMSTPAEPRFLRMRTELPPSHPSRLCFRTSLSGCSHMEVLNEIESQKNVKVTWLQYEPISLHYTDTAKPDYKHLCMWLFELSTDSDTSNLLLEGFTLRGHRMNVLHLDDVYLEEFRTFNLCNEIFMEQCSKHLIKNKPKRLVKANIYYQ